MPYKSIKSLPANVKKALPITAQKMFLEVFNNSFNKYGEDKSFKIAWEYVKRKYKSDNGKWISKASVVDSYQINSKSITGDNVSYFAEFIFSDTKQDLDGDSVPQSTLIQKLIGWQGDIEHANLYNKEDFDKKPLFEVVDSFFQGEQLFGKVKFNSKHKQFNDVWNYVQNGEFGISMEYKRKDSDWDIIGITGTVKPRNPRSKVVTAYTR